MALTTCNSERFIDAQLGSILGQTRPADEIVVGDDASTDGTATRVTAALADAPMAAHVRLHQPRMGYLANVETTARRTTGDLVFFADHDDVWRADKIDRLTGAMAGRTMTAAFTNARIIDDAGAPATTDLWSRAGFGATDRAAVREGNALAVLLQRRVATGATMVCTRDLFDAVFPVPDSAVHDHWIALIAATTGTLLAIDEPLIDYRLHRGNMVGMGARNPIRRIRDRFAAGDIPGREAATLAALIERVGDRLDPAARAAVEQAETHHRLRATLPRGFAARLRITPRELARGGYRRHHPSGPRSWLYDVVRTPARAAGQ